MIFHFKVIGRVPTPSTCGSSFCRHDPPTPGAGNPQRFVPLICAPDLRSFSSGSDIPVHQTWARIIPPSCLFMTSCLNNLWARAYQLFYTTRTDFPYGPLRTLYESGPIYSRAAHPRTLGKFRGHQVLRRFNTSLLRSPRERCWLDGRRSNQDGPRECPFF